jgi:hypothetical protein
MLQAFVPCMRLENLARLDAEPMTYDILKGIFAAFRVEHCSRSDLVDAISDWQVTEAKKALRKPSLDDEIYDIGLREDLAADERMSEIRDRDLRRERR